MADPAQPVLDQSAAVLPVPAEPYQVSGEQDEAPAGEGGGVIKSSRWSGMSNLTSYLADPYLLEQSINSLASNVAKVGLCYSSSAFVRW
jgi:hypothetical protein